MCTCLFSPEWRAFLGHRKQRDEDARGAFCVQLCVMTCSPTKGFSLKDEWRTDPQYNFGCNSTKLLHNKKPGCHTSFHSHGNKKYVRWIEGWQATVFVCLCVCMCVLKWCPGIIRYSSSYWLNNSCSCQNILCEHPLVFMQTLCWKALFLTRTQSTLKQPNNTMPLKWFLHQKFLILLCKS